MSPPKAILSCTQTAACKRLKEATEKEQSRRQNRRRLRRKDKQYVPKGKYMRPLRADWNRCVNFSSVLKLVRHFHHSLDRKIPSPSHTNMSDADPLVPLSVAWSPNDAAAVPGLLTRITRRFGKWRALETEEDDVQRDQARHDLLLEARALVQALETPRETTIKHCWAQVRLKSFSRYPMAYN